MMTSTCLIGVRVLSSFLALCETGAETPASAVSSAADAVSLGALGAELQAAATVAREPVRSHKDVRVRIMVLLHVLHRRAQDDCDYGF